MVEGNAWTSQRWQTFVRNHAQSIVACDFCLVVTATFRLLYVFVRDGARHAPHSALQCDGPSHSPNGTSSSCAKPSPLPMATASCCMTATAFSPSSSTSNIHILDSGSLKRRRSVPKPTPSVNGCWGRYGTKLGLP